jgi:hypothetical protein
MVVLLIAYLYKKYGHHLKLNKVGSLFQKSGYSPVMQPVKVHQNLTPSLNVSDLKG